MNRMFECSELKETENGILQNKNLGKSLLYLYFPILPQTCSHHKIIRTADAEIRSLVITMYGKEEGCMSRDILKFVSYTSCIRTVCGANE